jgi:hypothetical protein
MTSDSAAIVDNSIEHRRATVLRRQRDSFLALLRHAWQKSRFYRDLYYAAGIREHDLAAVALEDLPIIDKKLLMDNFDHAVTDPRLKKSDLERWIGEVGDPGLNYLTTLSFVSLRAPRESKVFLFAPAAIGSSHQASWRAGWPRR